MPPLPSDRFVRSLRRSPVILGAIIRDLDPERARTATDGPDGWSVVEIVCHLRDYEAIFKGRVERMLAEDNPALPGSDHEAMARDQRYQDQDLGTAHAAWLETRRAFLALLEPLLAEQWQRPGVHPEAGPYTVLDQVTRTALHDIDHTEQIVRALGLGERF